MVHGKVMSWMLYYYAGLDDTSITFGPVEGMFHDIITAAYPRVFSFNGHACSLIITFFDIYLHCVLDCVHLVLLFSSL